MTRLASSWDLIANNIAGPPPEKTSDESTIKIAKSPTITIKKQHLRSGKLQFCSAVPAENHSRTTQIQQKAIETRRDYIASEALVARWETAPLGEGAYKVEVKVEGLPLTIELRKALTVWL